MIEAIAQAFSGIPASELLDIAACIQADLAANRDLIRVKDQQQYVTQADELIQKRLLKYFSQSPLAGTYNIIAEEELSVEDCPDSDSPPTWQLIIDPLDGTNCFCRGETTGWGVMAGACDLNGRLIYSWNLLSTGEIYSSTTAQSPDGKLKRVVQQQTPERSFLFDVDDYGAGAAARFPQALEQVSAGEINAGQIEVCTIPAAINTGWQLYQGKIDGVLWLPSTKGKRYFPDYDLIFLGALAGQDWKIALGKCGDIVKVVAIAAGEDNLDLLWATAQTMITDQDLAGLEQDRTLRITAAV